MNTLKRMLRNHLMLTLLFLVLYSSSKLSYIGI